MKQRTPSPTSAVFLGLECGATHSTALWTDAAGQVLHQITAGPANVRLLTDAQLTRHFRVIGTQGPVPSALAIGMAGARTSADRQRIQQTAARIWTGVPCYATNDLETGLMAAGDGKGGQRGGIGWARVLVLSGTGSCCFGRAPDGQTIKVGGWGHILGDKSSGYEIGLQALQAVVHRLDCDGVLPALGQRILRALQLNDPEALVAWSQHATKPAIAALTMEVFAAWETRDRLAGKILTEASTRLAADAAACAHRLVPKHSPAQFVLAGSVLLKQPRFAAQVAREIRRRWPGARVAPLKRASVWGAIELARLLVPSPSRQPAVIPPHASGIRHPASGILHPASDPHLTRTLTQSPTEQRNPRSMNLDRMPLEAAIALLLNEDEKIPAALMKEQPAIARAIRLIVRAFRRGGRLFYVGAGTSGRLGVLDASECPPTFSVPPDMVQGIIAGGQEALWRSLEGAEDDPAAGAQAVIHRGVRRQDVVVGIAASGRTPFVWGALGEAKRRGAATVLLSFNPYLAIARADRPAVVIAPNVGPEVLTGSTRLKAGTATKLVLNLFTTLAMVQLGKVQSNLMVDVKASNTKLKDRATRILQELTGADYTTAQAALARCGWTIARARKHLATRTRTGFRVQL